MDIEDESDNICAICLCSLSNGECINTYECSHTFHVGCIKRMRNANNINTRGNINCPLCRYVLLSPEINVYHTFKSVIILLKKNNENSNNENSNNNNLNYANDMSRELILKKDEDKNLMNKILNIWICASNEGCIKAHYILGKIYTHGFYVEANLDKALKHLKICAEADFMNCYFYIGTMYQKGCKATPIDYKKAVDWYLLAIEKGCDKSMRNVADIYYFIYKNYATAYEYYMKLYTKNCVYATYIIGVMYNSGHGVAKDIKKAFVYISKAADGGNNIAQHNLGTIYYNGLNGQDKNYEKAFKYYKLSSINKSKKSQFMVGICYAKGHGINMDREKAYEYLELSAEQNYSSAQIKLGIMYLDDKKYEKAYYHINRSINNKNRNSNDKHLDYFLLGRMHYQGYYVERNLIKTINIFGAYLDLCEKDNVLITEHRKNAQYYLGMIYLNEEEEITIKQDLDKSLEYLLKSANNGKEFAIVKVIELYLMNNFAGKNHKEANKWINIAKEKIMSDHITYRDILFNEAYMYYYGYECEKNKFIALEMLKKLTLKQHAKAYILLYDIYNSENNTKTALKWLYKGASENIHDVQLFYMNYYFTNIEQGKNVNIYTFALKKWMINIIKTTKFMYEHDKARMYLAKLEEYNNSNNNTTDDNATNNTTDEKNKNKNKHMTNIYDINLRKRTKVI